MLYVLLLYALFAMVFTISKTGLMVSDPLFFVGLRMTIAGLLLLGYQALFQKERFSFDKRTWGMLLLLSLFNIYLTNVFEFWGLKYLSSSKTCFIYSLSPFLSALFCYFLFAERLTLKKWLGLFIGFAGFTPMFLNPSAVEEEMKSFLFLSWPEISVICAAICSVVGWITLKQVVGRQLSPLTANGVSMFVGGLLALGHSYAREDWNPLPVRDLPIFLESTLLLIVISNLICYNLYGALLKRYSATFISFAGFTTPLFAALFGWLALDEMISLPFIVSFLFVFAGLFLFHQDEMRASLLVP